MKGMQKENIELWQKGSCFGLHCRSTGLLVSVEMPVMSYRENMRIRNCADPVNTTLTKFDFGPLTPGTRFQKIHDTKNENKKRKRSHSTKKSSVTIDFTVLDNIWRYEQRVICASTARLRR
jgi:hypothetical protein